MYNNSIYAFIAPSPTVTYFFLVPRTFTIYSFSNFQIYYIVLLTIVTMLYIVSPGLTYFITKFVAFDYFQPFHPPCPHHPCLWQPPICSIVVCDFHSSNFWTILTKSFQVMLSSCFIYNDSYFSNITCLCLLSFFLPLKDSALSEYFVIRDFSEQALGYINFL